MRVFLRALVISAIFVSACSSTDESASPPASSPNVESSSSLPATTSTTEPPSDEVPADQPDLVIVVENGEVLGGVPRYEHALGTTLVIRVTSDVSDEVHLHAYDDIVDVEAGTSATLTVEANIPGVFELELESSGLLLAQIEIS